MEPFRIHILGCGSALPTLRHYASSQVVEVRGKMFMVDCGEGTQMQLRKTRVHFNRISTIFITHLHGDHCFGLMGMISTFGLLGRTAPLRIFGPAELGPLLVTQLDMFCQNLGYEVSFQAVDTTQSLTVYEDRSVAVSTIPLDHRIACCGYLFREKPLLPHIRRDMIDYCRIPLSQVNNIKMGADWTTEEGDTVPNSLLVTPPELPRAYAYCSDTAYVSSLPELLKGVDTLYHEATYASDNELLAHKYHHSTAREAALVARASGVRKLILGHYSSRYTDERVLLREAQEVFPASFLAQEMAVFNV